MLLPKANGEPMREDLIPWDAMVLRMSRAEFEQKYGVTPEQYNANRQISMEAWGFSTAAAVVLHSEVI